MPRKMTNNEIDEKLKYAPFKRIGEYAGMATKIEFQCLRCNGAIFTTPQNLIEGCDSCLNCITLISRALTNDEVDEKLIGTNFKRIGDYKTNIHKIEFECLRCNMKIITQPNIIFNGHDSCPNCNPLNSQEIN